MNVNGAPGGAAKSDEIPARAPFFSVLIPNYNGVRYLPDLFAGLASQSFTDFELIFADDASSDDSVAWVQASAPQARILAGSGNKGFVGTVNRAARAARGRVMVLLNNDTQPAPDFLAELAQTVCSQPRAGIVAAKLLLFEERDRIHTAGDMMGRDGIPRNRGVWATDSGQFDNSEEVFGGCGGAMAVRRELWEALEGFDEDFWMYIEDVDFSFRAQLLGWHTAFAPAAVVFHKLGGSGGDELSSFYVGRNTIWTLAKNMPTPLLLSHSSQIVKAQLSISADALRNCRGSAARARLRGQLAGLLGLPRVLRQRALVQARKRRHDVEIDRLLI
ncbi:MAG: glycosyltransferase family 2 protein [Caldilineaceae bacterium]|nr:glycosyltransferase family 2 protein [Caldilineaceae bacterium]